MLAEHLTPAELDTLLEAARAATQGEWLRSSLAVAYVVSEKGWPVIAAFAEYNVDGSIHKEFENGVANQEFVIRANPATIERLVLMVRELQQENEQLRLPIRTQATTETIVKQSVEHFRARVVREILSHKSEIQPDIVFANAQGELARVAESLPLVETEGE